MRGCGITPFFCVDKFYIHVDLFYKYTESSYSHVTSLHRHDRSFLLLAYLLTGT